MRNYFQGVLGCLLIVFVSCTVASPQKNPEVGEIWKKIQSNLAHASSARIKFHYEAILWDERSRTHFSRECSGDVLLKATNRAHIAVGIERPSRLFDDVEGLDRNFSLTSDGSRMVLFSYDVKRMKTPDRLNECLGAITASVGWARSPHVMWAYCAMYLEEPAPATLEEFIKLYEPRDFKAGPEDGDLRTLSYRFDDPILEGERASQSCEARIWYDARSLTLRKRSIKRLVTFPNRETAEETFTENYTEYGLGVELPDNDFGLEDQIHKVSAVPERARVNWTAGVIQQTCQVIDRYRREQGRYPERLADLVTAPVGVDPIHYPAGGYLKKLPQDAWDQSFLYRVPGMYGEPYSVGSLGSDGVEGGAGDARDIWSYDVYRRR